MSKAPPFQITANILKQSQEIARMLGILAGSKLTYTPVKLRRENKIKTVQASLSIEGNSLSITHVTSILLGKRIVGPAQEVKEVQNALKVYEDLTKWNPLSMASLKRAHKLLMDGLIASNGEFRTGSVGILKGKHVVHLAPSASMVHKLMENLFEFLKTDKTIPWLIKACVFHYELEFIHPFQDGNGRIGRLWQQLLLMKEDRIFEFISVESVIKANQKKYYEALEQSDKSGESTRFIEFSLGAILTALEQYVSCLN